MKKSATPIDQVPYARRDSHAQLLIVNDGEWLVSARDQIVKLSQKQKVEALVLSYLVLCALYC